MDISFEIDMVAMKTVKQIIVVLDMSCKANIGLCIVFKFSANLYCFFFPKKKSLFFNLINMLVEKKERERVTHIFFDVP